MMRLLAFLDRNGDRIIVVTLTALALLALLCLSGCGSRPQAQVIADAREIAKAIKQAPPEKIPALASALADDVLAATENVPDLPKPTHTAAEIITDPAIEAKPAAASAADPPPNDPPKTKDTGPGPSDILRGIGAKALHWGAWGALAGIVALLLRFVPWWSIGAIFSWGPLSTIAGLSASLGTFATIAGSAAMWLASYLWVVVLVAVLSGVGVAIFYWPQIRRAWRHIVNHIKKT